MSNKDSHALNIFKTEHLNRHLKKRKIFLLYFTGDWLEKAGFAFVIILTSCSMNLLHPKVRYATVTLNQYSLGRGSNSLGMWYDINNFEVCATALEWNRHLWVWRAQNVNYWLHGMIVVAFWEGSAAITERTEYIYINHLQIAVHYTTPTDSLWEPRNQSPLKMTLWQGKTRSRNYICHSLQFVTVVLKVSRQPSVNVTSKWIFGAVGK